MARRNRRRRRRLGFGFLYKVMSLLIICAVIVVALTLFFKVETVNVTGVTQYTDDEIIQASGIAVGDNMFLINKYSIAENMRQQLPAIESISMSRRLPSTIIINVTDSIKAGVISQNGKYWLISASGKIMSEVPEEEKDGYILITGCGITDPAVGEPVTYADDDYNSNGETLSSLIGALADKNLLQDISMFDLSDPSTVSMKYTDRFTVKINRGADYTYKLSNMLAVIDYLEDNEKGTIDLTIDGEAHFIP